MCYLIRQFHLSKRGAKNRAVQSTRSSAAPKAAPPRVPRLSPCPTAQDKRRGAGQVYEASGQCDAASKQEGEWLGLKTFAIKKHKGQLIANSSPPPAALCVTLMKKS